MRIDLHTHSDVSDGTAPPASVVRDAAAAGLDVVALTDHDTTAGWVEAEQAARDAGIDLVRGLEVSCTHRGHALHLLAYLPDPTHPGLVATLERIVAGRSGRIPAMLAQLREAGLAIDRADLDAGTPTAVLGRPHVADAMIRLGLVDDRTEAFRRWLDRGRPGYVDRWAAPVVDMVRTVREAGGAAVVAHPWGRGGVEALPETEIAMLASEGLAGIEVDHQDHDDASRARLRALAADLDLVVTGSSDHHGAGKVDHDLGCHTTGPEQYERLLARAGEAAATSGRTTPGVVRGRPG